MIILRKLDTTDYVSENEFTTYSGTIQQQISGHLAANNPHGITLPGLGAQDYLDFNLTPSGVSHREGRLHWDDDDKTLVIGMSDSDVHLQVGQEIYLRATNKTGATLLNGSVVFINGAQGNRPTIALANAMITASSEKTIGICTHDIENNTTGYVTTFGLVRNLNTASFSEGGVVWLSTISGAITPYVPEPPYRAVRLGHCIRVHSDEGVILAAVANGLSSCELHDVSCVEPSDTEVLSWNTLSGTYIPTNLNNRYYTKTEIDVQFNTLSGVLVSNFNNALTTLSGSLQININQVEEDAVAYAIALG